MEALKTAGDIVTLTVRYFKPAAVFLNKSGDPCKYVYTFTFSYLNYTTVIYLTA